MSEEGLQTQWVQREQRPQGGAPAPGRSTFRRPRPRPPPGGWGEAAAPGGWRVPRGAHPLGRWRDWDRGARLEVVDGPAGPGYLCRQRGSICRAGIGAKRGSGDRPDWR